jgi:hypothetical protein
MSFLIVFAGRLIRYVWRIHFDTALPDPGTSQFNNILPAGIASQLYLKHPFGPLRIRVTPSPRDGGNEEVIYCLLSRRANDPR